MVENILTEKIDKKILAIDDYGATYHETHVDFKVWAPYSDEVRLALYPAWDSYRRREYPMTKDDLGIWTLRLEGDYKDRFYNYIVVNHGQAFEIVDPYAQAAPANRKRAMIID